MQCNHGRHQNTQHNNDQFHAPILSSDTDVEAIEDDMIDCRVDLRQVAAIVEHSLGTLQLSKHSILKLLAIFCTYPDLCFPLVATGFTATS